MFFRSQRSLILAAVLIGIGCFQLLKGFQYRDVAKREASTVGKLLYVHRGKGSSYQYRYEVNGVAIRDDSGACKTALTAAGCEVGALVLVYYDRDDVTETLLEEFGAAGREKVFFGSFLAGCGLLLIGLYPIAKKALASPDESETEDVGRPAEGRRSFMSYPVNDLASVSMVKF